MARRVLLAVLVAMLPALVGCSSVVARVNGKNITRKEFYEELQRNEGLRVLQTTILRRLMLERAAAENLMPTAEEIAARYAQWKKERFNDDEQELRKWMKANATDDVVIQDQIRFELAMFKLRTRKLKPTEEDLKRFFNEYRDEYFDKPARVSFRQIVVPSKKVADELIAQLNNEGAMFAEIARKASLDDASKENGGLYEDLPWDMIKNQAPPIHAALQKLEVNQITQQPVKVGDAFVVLKLVEIKPVEPANYEAKGTKELVRERFLQANAISEQELMAEVGKGANVVVLDERYKGAIEPLFTGGQSGLPPELEKQLQQKPEMAEPTQIDEKTMPAPAPSGAGN
ncbi:MAG: peptidyl-prolyl cis-trans isomerase [Armatimonadetes bacterium]|nr:peptidyl-prolyl cis-trans isomerase [Armatimonadota bacterium]